MRYVSGSGIYYRDRLYVTFPAFRKINLNLDRGKRKIAKSPNIESHLIHRCISDNLAEITL